jgi:hypothetical protein
MTPPALLCDAPQCPGLGAEGLLIRTAKGELCAACWKRLGQPPALDPLPPGTAA